MRKTCHPVHPLGGALPRIPECCLAQVAGGGAPAPGGPPPVPHPPTVPRPLPFPGPPQPLNPFPRQPAPRNLDRLGRPMLYFRHLQGD